MISEDRLSKSLKYLAETDEPAAKAKALMLGLEEQIKSLKGILFVQLPSDMKVAEKDARVFAHEEYKNHIEKYQNAVADYEILKNKRDTEGLIVEVWRSLNANQRRGNV